MAVLLFVLFLLVPIVEIYVIIQVGQAIGAAPTFLLLVGLTVLGVWLVKREGRRTWAELRQASASGRVPNRELADGALLLIGGTLLVAPGFVTDVVGFFLVLPFTRPFARRALGWWVTRRATVVTYRATGYPGAGTGTAGVRPDGLGAPGGPVGPVIRGEVVGDAEDGPENGGSEGPSRAAGG